MTASPESRSTRPTRIDCLACGYDIFGLQPNGICPECGAKLEVSFFQTITTSAVRAMLIVKAVGVLVIGLALQWSYGNFLIAVRGSFETWEFWRAASSAVVPAVPAVPVGAIGAIGAVAPPSPLPHVIAFAIAAACEIALGLLLFFVGYSLLITRSRWSRRLAQRVAL